MVSTWKAEGAGLAVAVMRTVGLSRRASGERVDIIAVSSKLLLPPSNFSSLAFFPPFLPQTVLLGQTSHQEHAVHCQ